jgi:hypothetical protein
MREGNDMPVKTDMTVAVKVRSVYGNDLIYPDGGNAVVFAKMLGKKTLSQADLVFVRLLGFTVTGI